MACELIARLMLTLFNQKPFSAFPEECHTQHHEIYIYNTPTDAIKSNKKFKIISSQKLFSLFQSGEAKDRIRIVNNEGFKVTNTIASFEQMNEILQRLEGIEDKSKLNTFNSAVATYNSRFCTPYTTIYFANIDHPLGIQDKYNNFLPIVQNSTDSQILCDFKQFIIDHIAKNLYIVFDFKALEEVIFTSSIFDEIKSIGPLKAFSSAKTLKKTDFYFQNGEKYREKERQDIENINAKPTKKNKIIARTEKTDQKLLAKKAIEHLEIALKAFFPTTLTSEQYLSVIKSFTLLMEIDYGKDFGEFEQLLHDLRYWQELTQEISEETISCTGSVSSIEEDINELFEDMITG